MSIDYKKEPGRVTLNNGIAMPVIGLGVYRATKEEEILQAITTAMECGYRMIDTATIYENEEGVGKAIQSCGLPREELFITTKVWNDDQRAGRVEKAFEESLKRLQLDYVDLYLIHWPVKEKFIDTYKELEKIYASGRVKAIGVSNFLEHHLEELYEASGIIPAVNQFEIHPLLTQIELVDYCHSKGIVPEAYCPIARGKLTENPVLLEIGKKYEKTSNQVILRWEIQRGIITIPKSVTSSRIQSNIDIFDFELSKDDIMRINELNQNDRIAAHPDTFDF